MDLVPNDKQPKEIYRKIIKAYLGKYSGILARQPGVNLTGALQALPAGEESGVDRRGNGHYVAFTREMGELLRNSLTCYPVL